MCTGERWLVRPPQLVSEVVYIWLLDFTHFTKMLALNFHAEQKLRTVKCFLSQVMVLSFRRAQQTETRRLVLSLPCFQGGPPNQALECLVSYPNVTADGFILDSSMDFLRESLPLRMTATQDHEDVRA